MKYMFKNNINEWKYVFFTSFYISNGISVQVLSCKQKVIASTIFKIAKSIPTFLIYG